MGLPGRSRETGSLHVWPPGCSESAGFPALSLLSIGATMTHAVLWGLDSGKGGQLEASLSTCCSALSLSLGAGDGQVLHGDWAVCGR